jgi:hypothetical protein
MSEDIVWRVMSVKPFRGMYALEVLHIYTAGFWLWKKRHKETIRLVTRDGASFQVHPGEDRRIRNMQLRSDVEEELHLSLKRFLEDNPEVAEQFGA